MQCNSDDLRSEYSTVVQRVPFRISLWAQKECRRKHSFFLHHKHISFIMQLMEMGKCNIENICYSVWGSTACTIIHVQLQLAGLLCFCTDIGNCCHEYEMFAIYTLEAEHVAEFVKNNYQISVAFHQKMQWHWRNSGKQSSLACMPTQGLAHRWDAALTFDRERYVVASGT